MLSIMDLDDVRIFTKVAELGSFTKAAAQLDIPKSTVSRRVAELEEKLDVRLLQRSTRKLTLTHAGQLYFERTSRAIEELRQAELALEEMQSEPRGLLRITTPSDVSGLLAHLIGDFQEKYPLVDLIVFSTGRRVDLIAEGYDVALRAGRLSDSSMLSKKLIDTRIRVFASPGYVERHGVPKNPSDLESHRCLIFGQERLENEWQLAGPKGPVTIKVTGHFASNDFSLLLGACLRGLGVAFLPAFEPDHLVKAGRLVQLLPQYVSEMGGLYAVYPSGRHLSPNVRAFVDFAFEWLHNCENVWNICHKDASC